ncbi:MAG: hypothetical protein ACLR8P_12180 [Clostridium fessum]
MAKYEEPLDLDKLLDGLTLAKLQKAFDAVMKRNANKLRPGAKPVQYDPQGTDQPGRR